ncbi:MAG: transposase [Candidatus Kapaibacterium sp.]
MAAQKIYTQEFRDAAVRQSVSSGKSVSQVAKDLGINVNTLHTWRREAISTHRMPVPEHESLEAEIKRLRRELALMTEERDIITKTIA